MRFEYGSICVYISKIENEFITTWEKHESYENNEEYEKIEANNKANIPPSTKRSERYDPKIQTEPNRYGRYSRYGRDIVGERESERCRERASVLEAPPCLIRHFLTGGHRSPSSWLPSRSYPIPTDTISTLDHAELYYTIMYHTLYRAMHLSHSRALCFPKIPLCWRIYF